MKKILKIFLLIMSVLFVSSCSDFLDVNEDRDNPSTTAPKNRLPAVLGNAATLTFNAGQFSVYYSTQIATDYGYDATRDRWDFSQQVRVGIFRHHYHDVAGNANNLVITAEETENAENFVGVGKLMLAYSFLLTTDVIGDMPFNEAFSGKDSPKYDDQQTVYEGIGQWIDEAIAALETAQAKGNAIKPMSSNSDPIFAGDLVAWKAFAHALKARWLIHQSNVGSDMNAIIAEVDAALAGWKSPSYPFTGEDDWTRNPWGPQEARPLPYSMRTHVLNSSAPSIFFYNLLETEDETLDPRAALHFEPNGADEILPVVPGQGIGSIDGDDMPGLLDMARTKDDSPIEFISEAELYFIKAEAAFATDKTMAYNSFLDGIRSDMEALEVPAGEQQAFLENADFVPQSANDLTLADIMTQKLIATYLSPEAWVDIRRYAWSDEVYPGLTRPVNTWEEVYGEDLWITRVPYNMETEYIYNLPEIERLGAKDPKFLTTRLWWMPQN